MSREFGGQNLGQHATDYRTKMTRELVIRRPQATEYGSVQPLIETVANETFKDLFAPNPVPLKFKDEDWPLSWVAVSDERIVGVILTNREWVNDLWALPEQRRRGVGGKLLAQGEAEIATRGYRTCHLRVVRFEYCRSVLSQAFPSPSHLTCPTTSQRVLTCEWIGYTRGFCLARDRRSSLAFEETCLVHCIT